MAGISPVTAAAARTGSAGPAASSTIYGMLDGAASASDAWAAGSAGTGKTLILHWNGTSWK